MKHIRDFSDGQKQALLSLAYELASADDYVSDIEQSCIDRLARDMDLPHSLPSPHFTITAAAAQFTNRVDRVAAMLALIVCAFGDDEFDSDEGEILNFLRDSFGLSQRQYAACHRWVTNYRALREEANILMGLHEAEAVLV